MSLYSTAFQIWAQMIKFLFLLTLHLDEELCLDSTRCFTLVLAPGAAEGVDLVYENDWRFVFSS